MSETSNPARYHLTDAVVVGFIILLFVIVAFFSLSRVHPPRKKIAVLSPTVCEWFLSMESVLA